MLVYLEHTHTAPVEVRGRLNRIDAQYSALKRVLIFPADFADQIPLSGKIMDGKQT